MVALINNGNNKDEVDIDDVLADEAAELDGYFSDAPLKPQPNYPPLKTDFDTSIIITNLPAVPASKVDKLTKVILKLVSHIGPLSTATGKNNDEDGDENKASDDNDNSDKDAFNGVMMPFDEATELTLGFCFVEYETPEIAMKAVKVLQDYKFDKNHTLSVTSYPRAQQLQALQTDHFEEPTISPFQEMSNPMAWLEDPNQRDAYAVRYGKETAVYWFDAQADPIIDYDGAREKEAGVQWCEYYCHWSPAGSYLATLVPERGVILWCGANYEKAGRFVAPGVKHVIFSPQETYLMTSNDNPTDPAAIKVYHIPSSKLLRAFPLYPDPTSAEKSRDKSGGDNASVPPPPFLWSHDDQYLARMGKDLISVYETPGMHLLEKRSLDCPGISEFQWSPTANILAYWAPEAINSPAHVDLIQIPSRKKLRQKNLFNVSRCNMVWHDQGEYLAVKVTRHTKSKKTLYNNIELFRLANFQKTGDVPVEMLDMKDAVMALAWEPRGSRLAMIHAENPSAAKVQVSFYDMMKTTIESTPGTGKSQEVRTPELNKVVQLDGRQCNRLFWSPAGSTILMASLGDTASGTLEFYDVDSRTMVAVKEHYRCNQVSWDPDGRAVATIVSQPIGGGHFKFAMDNGYILWSFQGKQLYQQSYETFYQFVWRPRARLLSRSAIEKVKKNLKTYERRFDKADRKRQRALYLQETAGKRAERSKIRDLLARNRGILAKQRARHIELLGGYDSDDDAHYIIRDMTIETILSTKEEVLG